MTQQVPATQAKAGAPAAFDFKTQRPSAAFAVLDPGAESLSDGIGASYGVIGYKGKTWSLRHRGEKHLMVRSDDGTPISYIDVVVLRQARVKAKSYYKDYDEAASEGQPPICASIDGVRPDAGVAEQQAEACVLCPRNAWKTDENGRKGRDCSDYKRLAVLLLPKQTTALLGQALMEPVFLRVPPASLNDLAIMGETMASQGWHFSSFILRISFDPAVSHPKFVFRPIQPLSDKEAAVVLPLRNDPLAIRITGEDQSEVVSGGTVAVTANQMAALPAPKPAQAAPKPAAPKAPAPQARPPVSPQTAAPAPAPKSVQPVKPAVAPKPKPKVTAPPPPPPPPPVDEPVGDDAFGSVPDEQPVLNGEVIHPEGAAGAEPETATEEVVEQATEQVPAGEGSDAEPKDTDAALDAEIAALLKG